MSASAASKLALSLVGASLLLAPPPAAADRDWDDDDGRGYYSRSHRHDNHHKHRKHWNDHGRSHRHGDWCPPQHFRPYVYRRPAYYYGRDYGPRYYYNAPPVRRVRYYCDPCDHWYGSEASFHYHVHHSHGIARALIPAVIAATVFGYIFAGY